MDLLLEVILVARIREYALSVRAARLDFAIYVDAL